MHADPITHADQHTDRLGAEADALQAAEIAVDIEIREAFEAFYAGEECGWGLRCTRAISDGTFVVEV